MEMEMRMRMICWGFYGNTSEGKRGGEGRGGVQQFCQDGDGDG